VGIEKNGPQGVVDLVGHSRGQLPHRSHLFRLDQLLLSFPELAMGLGQAGQILFQLIDEVGQAHFVFRQPPVHGAGFFLAGSVPAGPAVQFILGVNFVGPPQDLPDDVRARRGQPPVVGAEVSSEGNPGVLAHVGLVAVFSFRLEAGLNIAGHQFLPGKGREVIGKPRSVDASFAKEEVQEFRLHGPLQDFFQDLGAGLFAFGDQNPVLAYVLLHGGAAQQSPGHGKDSSQPREGTVCAALLQLLQNQARLLEHPVQFHEGQDGVHVASHLRVLDLLLFGDTRADEDHFGPRLKAPFDHPSHGHHGGDDGR
jgi:hypothetical protein